MNKIYKVVWSISLGVWVAVSENTKAKNKTTSKSKKKLGALLVVMGTAGFIPHVFAEMYITGGETYIGTGANQNQTSTAISACGNTNGNLDAGDAYASGQTSIAIGCNAISAGVKSIAIGDSAFASKDGSVALGANSKTDGDAQSVSSVEINGDTYHFAGSVSGVGQQVSVGSIGFERQIKNVAPGVISATSTDAVNGSQLYAVVGALNVLDGQISAAANGSWLLKTDTNPAVQVDNNNIVTLKSGNNIALSQNGLDVTIATSMTPSFTTLATTGNADIGGDLTVTGISNLNGGADLNNQKITNLAAGDISSATSTDAVNGGQLFTTNQNVSNLNTTVTNQGNSISNLQNQTFQLQANGDAASSVKSSDTVQFIDGTNIKITRSGNDITVATASDVNFDKVVVGSSVTAGDTILSTTGINIGSTVQLNNTGLMIAGGPSVTTSGIDAGGQVISNVASAGALSAANTNAVNAADVFNAVAGVQTTLELLEFGLKAEDGNSVSKKPGETVEVVGADSNISTEVSDGKIAIKLSDDLDVNSITAGNTILNSAGVSIGSMVQLNNMGLMITGGPSVTTSGIDAGGQVISNVASAGALSAANTNAANAADVFNAVAGVQTTLESLEFGLKASDGNSVSKKLGETVEVVGADSNITTEVSDGKIAIKLSDDLDVNSITAGNTILNSVGVSIGSMVQLNNTGLMIAGGPSVTTSGIDAGGQVISNVAAAVNDTDAVNKKQLSDEITKVSENMNALSDRAVQYDQNADNSTNKNQITLAGGSDGTLIKNVADGAVEAGSKDAINGGQLAEVRDTLQNQINTNTTDITNIKNDINNGAMGLVQQAGGDADVTVAKNTGGSKVNVSGTAGDRIVTGVANGVVSSSSKDAINGSQLNATNQALVSYLGGGAAYDNITGSFNAPSYQVGNASYTNVGDTVTALNNADIALGNRITNLGDQLQQAFYGTNQRINDVEKQANAGIAAAIAMEAAPYVAGKYTYAVGAAYHEGENAVGVTLRRTADNGRWSITGGIAAASQGDPSFRIGISGVID